MIIYVCVYKMTIYVCVYVKLEMSTAANLYILLFYSYTKFSKYWSFGSTFGRPLRRHGYERAQWPLELLHIYRTNSRVLVRVTMIKVYVVDIYIDTWIYHKYMYFVGLKLQGWSGWARTRLTPHDRHGLLSLSLSLFIKDNVWICCFMTSHALAIFG